MVLAVVVQIGQVVITAVAAYSRFSVSGNDRKYERAPNRFWVFQLLCGPALRYSARRCCVADPARHLFRFPEIVHTDREHSSLNKIAIVRDKLRGQICRDNCCLFGV